MSAQKLLFIFSHAPSSSLAWDAWDAAMTAGLLDQSVTILLSGAGRDQLLEPRMVEKITSLQEMLPVQLRVEGKLNPEHRKTPLAEQLELIDQASLPAFVASFDRILSF